VLYSGGCVLWASHPDPGQNHPWGQGWFTFCRGNPILGATHAAAQMAFLLPCVLLLPVCSGWAAGGRAAPMVGRVSILRSSIVECEPLMRVPLKQLVAAFERADADEDGSLNLGEFKQAVACSGAVLGDAAAAALFLAADVDGSGDLTINEFLAPRAVPELLCELPNSPKAVTTGGYQPSAVKLWKTWRGTVLETTWRPALAVFTVSTALVLSVGFFGSPTWSPLTLPDAKHPLIARLLPMAGLWDKLLTLTTFIVTFFVGQTLSFWRSCYGFARSVASRLSDLNLALAAHADRTPDGQLSPESAALLGAAARNSRLFHLLYWALLVPRYQSVASDAGLERLVEVGHCTQKEAAALRGVPLKARHHTVMLWLVERGVSAAAASRAAGGAGGKRGGLAAASLETFHTVWMDRSWALRSAYGKIGQALDACMPNVYMHLVQVLVDVLLVLMPLALYARYPRCRSNPGEAVWH
jgi:hypothetical protein